MMIGGVTAFGIGDLPIYVDSAVMEQDQVVMGGGNRSSKLLLNPRELAKLPNVVVVEGLAKPVDRWPQAKGPQPQAGALHVLAEAARFELAMGINPNPLSRRAP